MPFWLNKLAARTGVGRLLGSAAKDDGAAAFRRYLSDRALASPPADFGAGETHDPDAIDLASSAPRFDVPLRVPSERRGSAPPMGLLELRQAIAGMQPDVDPTSELLITHGATGALASAFDALLNPGQRVVLFDPTSPLYSPMLRQRRARVHWVPTWVEQGNLRFHLEPFAKALAGAKLVVLADPVNPTGSIVAPEDFEQIAWWANRHDVLLIHDRTLARFEDGSRAPLATLPHAANRTVTIGSFSRGHGLPSIRVGWIAGHRHLIAPCLAAQSLTASLVPTVCQQLALAAMQAGEAPFRATLDQIAGRRRFVYERLKAMTLLAPWPAAGFYLWVPVFALGMTGQAFAEKLRNEKKVLVAPGEAFGPSGSGFVRLSVGGDEGRLLEGLTRLAEMLAGSRVPLAG